MGGGLLFWSFYWEERCNKGLERLHLRLSAPTTSGCTSAAQTWEHGFAVAPVSGCEDRGQPPRLAAWP
jgi:hypothetical protein